MNTENLKKSYMLIGPSGVGKSLIAKNLSQKTGLPIFSIDEILAFTQDKYSKNSLIFNRRKLLKCYKKLAYDNGPSYEKNSDLDLKQNEMFNELADMFFYYEKKLGGFNEIKNAYLKHFELDDQFDDFTSPLVSIYIYQTLTIDVYKIILEKINEPVIFDMPCNFAWFLPKDNIFKECDIDYKAQNSETKKILESLGSVILVEPGQDFEQRNPEKKSFYFEYLLNHKSNYKESDIMISTNDFFYDPTNPALNTRSICDAEAQLTREQLLNKAELNNICDQIITMSQALTCKSMN